MGKSIRIDSSGKNEYNLFSSLNRSCNFLLIFMFRAADWADLCKLVTHVKITSHIVSYSVYNPRLIRVTAILSLHAISNQFLVPLSLSQNVQNCELHNRERPATQPLQPLSNCDFSFTSDMSTIRVQSLCCGESNKIESISCLMLAQHY